MKWTLQTKAIATILSLAAAGIVAWAAQAQLGNPHQHQDKNQTLLGQMENNTIPVSVVTASYMPITQTIVLTGSLKSSLTSNVSANVPGQVQAVYVTEGSQVKAGDLLAQLNPAQAETQAAQARQGINAAQSAYLKALGARELTYRQALGDVEQARLGLQQAETGLARANAGAGSAAIAQAEAQARQAQAGAREAAEALRRTQFLFDHGVVPQSTLDDVRTKAVQASAGADAAEAAARQAREGGTPEDRRLAADKVAQAQQGLRQAEESRKTREAIADADARAALTQVHSAQEQFRLGQIALGATRIISPIDGVVTTVRTHGGESAMPGSPLFMVTSTTGVYFETAVSETQKVQLKPGQSASITMQAVPGKTFVGRVRTVVPVENPGSAGFLARISIDPAGARIPPGAYARATVEIGSAPHALAIPAQTILTDSHGRQYVYVVDDHHQAAQHFITTGITNGAAIQVLTGLQEGDQVVSQGQEFLHTGSMVSMPQPIAEQ